MYHHFAYVYDDFMDHIPYDRWFTLIKEIWGTYHLNPQSVLDLGCGTGNMTSLFAASYETLGIDLSTDMLTMARQKDEKSLYIQQDMRDFTLPHPVDAVISLCDSMNYLLTEGDFLSTLNQVYQALSPGGIFVFDLKTPLAFESYGEEVFVDQTDNASYIWENFYDPKTYINYYDLTLFIEESPENLYHKYAEYHEERAYPLDILLAMIQKSKFTLLEIIHDETRNPVDILANNKASQRIHMVLQKGIV